MNNGHGLKGAVRLFRMQWVIIFVISIITLLVSSVQAAVSVLLGGLVSIIPNMYFARMLFKYHGAQAARKIVNSFYKGEAIKMLLTVSLFALVFKSLKVVPLAFFAGFIVAQLLIWFAPLFFDNKRKWVKK